MNVTMRSACLMTAVLGLAACTVTTSPNGQTIISSRVAPAAATGNVQEQRIVAGRTVQVLMVGNGHAVAVDGRAVIQDSQDDHVIIRSVHQGDSRVYVLIEEQSGGNACPSMYQVIDLSGGKALVSPQFGNCSETLTVSVIDGSLRVALSAYRAARSKTYLIKDGRVRG